MVLTPEEWVRQNFLNYLVKKMDYPGALMSIEKEMNLGELRKRCDIVVYTREAEPWMIVECKEMGVPLNNTVLEQIVRYHIALPVPYLVITNGSNTCLQDGYDRREMGIRTVSTGISGPEDTGGL